MIEYETQQSIFINTKKYTLQDFQETTILHTKLLEDKEKTITQHAHKFLFILAPIVWATIVAINFHKFNNDVELIFASFLIGIISFLCSAFFTEYLFNLSYSEKFNKLFKNYRIIEGKIKHCEVELENMLKQKHIQKQLLSYLNDCAIKTSKVFDNNLAQDEMVEIVGLLAEEEYSDIRKNMADFYIDWPSTEDYIDKQLQQKNEEKQQHDKKENDEPIIEDKKIKMFLRQLDMEYVLDEKKKYEDNTNLMPDIKSML